MDMRKYKKPIYTKGISDIRVREYTLENNKKVIISHCRSMFPPNIFIGWSYPEDNNMYFNTYWEALDYYINQPNS